MQPRRDAIGRRPDLLITNDGPVEGRLLGPAPEVNPCSDTARWRLVPYSAPDFGFMEAQQDAL
jgi:hypothetical protein